MTKVPRRRRAAALSMVLVLSAAVPAQQDEPPSESPPAPRPPQRVEPMPVPRSLVKRRKDPIVVDGSLQDWPEAPPLLLDDPRQLSGTALGAWRGPDDLAARAFLLWDADALYVAAVVRDDWHRPLDEQTPRGPEIPAVDNVLLTIDPRRDTRGGGPDEGRREDRSFWLADVPKQDGQVLQWDRLGGTARFANGAQQAVVRDAKARLTTYEARIPWSEILPTGIDAKDGLVLDLQMVVSDYDEPTDLLPQTRVGWTFGTGDRIDPGLFGSVMLVDDLPEAGSPLPDFPPPPDSQGSVPPPSYWIGLWRRLQEQPPVPYTRDSTTPADALGEARLKMLEELERHAAEFPRVDFLEYHERSDRRMRREVAGMVETGLPLLWEEALNDVRRRVVAPPPENTVRVFRLPAGGWLVRSAAANFGIDPAGYSLAPRLWGALDFVLLTSPLDVIRRSDQLLIRLAAAKRQFLTHVPFHLPAVAAGTMPLVQIGQSYALEGLKVTVVGKKIDDQVSPTVGYVVRWPNGFTLVEAGMSADVDDFVQALGGSDVHPDVLVVSPLHPRGKFLVQRLSPRLTLLEDVLRPADVPGPQGRVKLADALEFQQELRPYTSVLLAPGESFDVTVSH